MATKEIDIPNVVKRSFDWASEPSLKRLFGAFFAADIFPLLLFGIIFCLLASVTAVSFIDNAFSLDPTMVLMVILGAAITLVITAAIVYYALSLLGWTKDKSFMSLAWELSKIRTVLYAITFATVILAIIIFFVVFNPSFTGEFSISLLIGIPILLILFTVICLSEAFWTYINNFFLIGKMMELRGKRNEFTRISIENYIKFLKFEVVRFFAICLNWLDSRILVAQAILLALTLILLILAIASSTGMLKIMDLITSLLWAIAFGMLYLVLLMYCSIRLYIATPVRVLESKGSISSIKIAWEKTRGNTLNIFFTMILLMLALFVVGLASFILDILSQLPVQIGMQFTPLLIIALPVYVIIMLIQRLLMGNVVVFTTLLTVLNLYEQIGKANKASK